MDKLKKIRESEPVRVWVYPLLLAGLGIALKEGYLDAGQISLIELVLYGLLGVGGVEAARQHVTPVRPADHELVKPDLAWQSSGAHARTEPLQLPHPPRFGQ